MSPSAKVDEQELIAAVLRKDRKASAEFVALYADAIYSYVHHRLLPRTDLVDDLVQDVFLAAWESLPSFRGDSSARSWLLGIARHRVEDYYRSRLRDPLPEDADTEERAGPAAEFRLEEALDREQLCRRTKAVLEGLRRPTASPCFGAIGRSAVRGKWRRKPDAAKKRLSVFSHGRALYSRRGGTVIDPIGDDTFFERLAAGSDPSGFPPETAPVALKDKLFTSLVSRQQDDGAFDTLAASAAAEPVPPSLKSRIYSALVARQAASGPLLSLPAVKAGGRGLCVFEELVQIAPFGENMKSFNCCRVCHARVLAEHMDSAPIYWPRCPYVGFQNR